MKYPGSLIIFAMFCATATAQNTRTDIGSVENNSTEVFMRERQESRKSGGRWKEASTRNTFAEVRLKERRKMAEDMKQPQYADKMYFGHKRPPKKRPLHKRKFCKECGIVH